MDHLRLTDRGRRRVGRRRAGAAAPARPDPRWVWLALGMLALLLVPGSLWAQGLRSAVASVSLVAVKHPPGADAEGAGTARDALVLIPARHPDDRVSVRLESDGVAPIYVRALTGRLERAGRTPIPVGPGPIAVRSIGAPQGATWKLLVTLTSPDGTTRERVVEVSPRQR